MQDKNLYRCFICDKWRPDEDFPITDRCGNNFSNRCRYCLSDRRFRDTAICYILNIYKLRAGEYSDELLEIETIRAKTRWLLRGNESKFITYKNENMITTVNNSTELRQALNENLSALLTKKRKLLVAKEVNNTLGKIQMDVKMELMQNAIIGNKERITWFDDNKSKMIEQYGCYAKLKEIKPEYQQVQNA